MGVYSKRPGDMRSREGDTFDFGASQRRDQQFRAPALPRTSRGRKLGQPAKGEVALAIGAMAVYWLTPMLASRRRPKRPQ